MFSKKNSIGTFNASAHFVNVFVLFVFPFLSFDKTYETVAFAIPNLLANSVFETLFSLANKMEMGMILLIDATFLQDNAS